MRLALGQLRSHGELSNGCVGAARHFEQYGGVRRDERPRSFRGRHVRECTPNAYAARTVRTFSISSAGVKGFWMNGPSAAAFVYPEV